MSYAVMLFEELFASQLSVPSSPAHPTNCTTVLMKIYQTKKKKQKTIIIDKKNNTRRVFRKLHLVYIVRTMIRSYFGIDFFRICQECISTDRRLKT